MTTLIDLIVDFLLRLFGREGATQAPSAKRSRPAASGCQYQRVASLLTPGEMAFYQALREAVPSGVVIQCKVRMVDLIAPQPDDLTAFRRVSQKHIDFALCHAETLEPLVAVELDDRSHQRADRVERDTFVNAAFRSASLPLLRIPAQRSYSLPEVRQALFAHARQKAA